MPKYLVVMQLLKVTSYTDIDDKESKAPINIWVMRSKVKVILTYAPAALL